VHEYRIFTDRKDAQRAQGKQFKTCQHKERWTVGMHELSEAQMLL